MYNFKIKFGILGYPLNKPRSVKIWKQYIKEHSINASMKAYEVNDKNFEEFINQFISDKKFQALVVTMPFKKKVLEFSNIIHNTALGAKSANLLLKKSKKIYAYNTDVLGAYYSIKNYIRKYEQVCIIGLGGTGVAIFSYLYNKFKNKKFILISSNFNFKSNRVKIFKNLDKNIICNKCLIINCSPLGSNLKKEYQSKTPINENIFQYISPKSFIFDIVYKPKKTKLSELSKIYKINYINGLLMNTIQAQKALSLTFDR